jgi:AcrR family transcriptional regulator
MSPRVYSSARDRILDAAERLLLAGGASRLTVEAVAGEAKVSKGGFFHHFATKDELLVAILERLVGGVMAEIESRAGRDPEPRGARLRAHIALAFDMDKASFEKWMALLLALIQVAGSQPALIRRGRQINAEEIARDEAEGIPVGRAIAVQFALDGYGLAVGLGSTELSPEQRAALKESLMALAQPEETPPRVPARSKQSKQPKQPKQRGRP